MMNWIFQKLRGVIMVKHKCEYLSDCCDALPVSRLDCDEKVWGYCNDCGEVATFDCDGHYPTDDDDPKWWL